MVTWYQITSIVPASQLGYSYAILRDQVTIVLTTAFHRMATLQLATDELNELVRSATQRREVHLRTLGSTQIDNIQPRANDVICCMQQVWCSST